jgi:uncharacterized protein (TIGR03435 family)
MDWRDDEYEALLRRFQPRKPGIPPGMAHARSRRRGFWLTAVCALALLAVSTVFMVRNRSRIDANVTADPDAGAVSRAPGSNTQIAQESERVQAGQVVHSNAGGVFGLPDGSQVEMRAESEFSVERADDGISIRLSKGSIIVSAVRQRAGHLYVLTKDVTVAVVGTVFLVKSEEKGSRVAVIHGEVQVRHGVESKRLLPGEQVATNPLIELQPVEKEISWSRDAVAHMALLQSAAGPTVAASQNPAPAPEAFEVASVRPNNTPAPPLAAIIGPMPCRGRLQVDPSRFIATNVTLYRLIALGYAKHCPTYPSRETDLISGGAEWIRSDAFDVQGVIPVGSTSYTDRHLIDGHAPKLQAMIQTLVVDRFKLALHREMKEMPVYNLVVVDAEKLKVHKEDPSETRRAGPPPGVVNFGVDPPNGTVTLFATAIPISALVNLFQGQVGRYILDRTDLKGQLYDIPRMTVEVGVFEISPTALSVWPQIADKALPQLGLKLEPARAAVEVLVIDRAERPSEN